MISFLTRIHSFFPSSTQTSFLPKVKPLSEGTFHSFLLLPLISKQGRNLGEKEGRKEGDKLADAKTTASNTAEEEEKQR